MVRAVAGTQDGEPSVSVAAQREPTGAAILWHAAGRPPPKGRTGARYRLEPASGCCATCAAPIAEGVPFTPRRGVAGIDNDTFHGHAEYARWGTHVCAGCAWLYGDPKRTHRGVLALGDRLWWPMIGEAAEDRPRWRTLLGWIAAAPPRTPLTGVLTADPKPRLWPRARAAVAGRPGLYLHIPDADWSRWTPFALRDVAQVLAAVDTARLLGFTKRAIWTGSGASPAMCDRWGLAAIEAAEAALKPWRGTAALLIAVTVA